MICSSLRLPVGMQVIVMRISAQIGSSEQAPDPVQAMRSTSLGGDVRIEPLPSGDAPADGLACSAACINQACSDVRTFMHSQSYGVYVYVRAPLLISMTRQTNNADDHVQMVLQPAKRGLVKP